MQIYNFIFCFKFSIAFTLEEKDSPSLIYQATVDFITFAGAPAIITLPSITDLLTTEFAPTETLSPNTTLEVTLAPVER